MPPSTKLWVKGSPLQAIWSRCISTAPSPHKLSPTTTNKAVSSRHMSMCTFDMVYLSLPPLFLSVCLSHRMSVHSVPEHFYKFKASFVFVWQHMISLYSMWPSELAKALHLWPNAVWLQRATRTTLCSVGLTVVRRDCSWLASQQCPWPVGSPVNCEELATCSVSM